MREEQFRCSRGEAAPPAERVQLTLRRRQHSLLAGSVVERQMFSTVQPATQPGARLIACGIRVPSLQERKADGKS